MAKGILMKKTGGDKINLNNKFASVNKVKGPISSKNYYIISLGDTWEISETSNDYDLLLLNCMMIVNLKQEITREYIYMIIQVQLL